MICIRLMVEDEFKPILRGYWFIDYFILIDTYG